MPSKLSKWGNSLGVRLPSYVAERAGLLNGDYLYIKLMDSGDMVIRPVKQTDVHPGYATAGEAEAVFQDLSNRFNPEFFWVALCVHKDSYLNGNRRLRTI